jgi:hypothetical protein
LVGTADQQSAWYGSGGPGFVRAAAQGLVNAFGGGGESASVVTLDACF